MDNAKRYGAEFLGTLLLVLLGVGSEISSRVEGGVVVVGLAFGLVLTGLFYVLAPLSGCHVNPAVTLGMLISRRISLSDAVAYWIAQFVGAIIGALLLYALRQWGDMVDQTGALGSNGYGANINRGGAFLLEILLTFAFTLAVLVITSRARQLRMAGLVIGAVFGACMLVSVDLDGGSVNPARSLGPALFSGGTALSQLWLFIVAPLIGAVLAAYVAPFLVTDERAPAEEPPRTEPAYPEAPAPPPFTPPPPPAASPPPAAPGPPGSPPPPSGLPPSGLPPAGPPSPPQQ